MRGLGAFAVALVQGVYIMLGTMLMFGVRWGDPFSAILIVVAFGLVGSGAAMLMGALFSIDQQAAPVGVFLGLGTAALGGCMLPLYVMELFAPGVWTAAHVTPHAWALEAFEALVRDDGGIGDVLPFLGSCSDTRRRFTRWRSGDCERSSLAECPCARDSHGQVKLPADAAEVLARDARPFTGADHP